MRHVDLVAAAARLIMRGMWVSIGVLFLLVSALGGWIFWLQKTPESTQPTLADIDPQSIQHIVIGHADETMAFTRQPSGWIMTQPFHVPADPYHMEQLTALPKQTSHAQYQISEKELAQFELAPPRILVRLDNTEFRFGMQNPIDFRRYVQVDGGPVQLIDDSLMSLLTAPATSWIDTRLLPSSSLRALELPHWHLTLTDKGTWTSKPKADAETLHELVGAWRNARAIQITPYSGEIPDEAPRIQVQLEKARIEFVLLQREPEMILLRPELKLSYHFYGNIGRRLLAPQSSEPHDSP